MQRTAHQRHQQSPFRRPSAWVPANWKRAGQAQAARVRRSGYGLVGAAAALTGPWLILVQIAAGLVQVALRARASQRPARRIASR
jgi:chromate transporter